MIVQKTARSGMWLVVICLPLWTLFHSTTQWSLSEFLPYLVNTADMVKPVCDCSSSHGLRQELCGGGEAFCEGS